MLTFEPPMARQKDSWPNSKLRACWEMLSNYIDTWPKEFYEHDIVECLPHFPRTYFINDPAFVKFILVNRDQTFGPTWQQERLTESLFGGKTIASDTHENWKLDRQMYKAAASLKGQTDLDSYFLENADRLVSQWAKTGRYQKIDSSISIYALKNILRLTLTNVKHENAVILGNVLSKYRKNIGNISISSIAKQWSYFPAGLRRGGNKVLQNAESLLQSEIDDRRGSNEKGCDFLSQYLAQQKLKGSNVVPDSRITANALAFVAAGYDTTASALTWFFYLIGRSQSVQDQIRQEIMPYSETDRIPSIREVPLTYQAFQETLRLYPPLPLLGREAKRRVVWKGKTYSKHSIFFISPYVVHRHKSFWPNPNTFDHQRFNAIRKKEILNGSYLPFGFGQRSCIGVQLTLRELIAAAIKVLPRYRLIVDERHKVKLASGLGLSPKSGIMLKVEPLG